MATPDAEFQKKVVRTILFDPKADPAIRMQPDEPMKVAADGQLQWNIAGNAEGFRIVMKEKNGKRRTPFRGGATETGGVQETPVEDVDPNAYHGEGSPENRYSYTVHVTYDGGKEKKLDPDVVVGPQTRR